MGVVDPLPAVLRVAPFAGNAAAGFVRRPAPVTLGVRRNVWQAPSSAFSPLPALSCRLPTVATPGGGGCPRLPERGAFRPFPGIGGE